MKLHHFFLGFSFSLMGSLAVAQNTQTMPLQYPTTRQVDQVDSYFGTDVADPYRWLEDDRSAETAAWVETQNELTFAYLHSIPFRDNIEKRLTTLWDYEKYSTPSREGDYYYFFKNNGLQNQSVLYQ